MNMRAFTAKGTLYIPTPEKVINGIYSGLDQW